MLQREYSSKNLASIDDDMEKSITSLSFNTGNGKTMLCNELLARRSSLTVREVSFVNELIQCSNIKAAQLQQKTKVLGDSNLFFDCDDKNAKLSKSSPARMNCQLKSSTKRLSALNFRRFFSIHLNLWHLRENGISTNAVALAIALLGLFVRSALMTCLAATRILYSIPHRVKQLLQLPIRKTR